MTAHAVCAILQGKHSFRMVDPYEMCVIDSFATPKNKMGHFCWTTNLGLSAFWDFEDKRTELVVCGLMGRFAFTHRHGKKGEEQSSVYRFKRIFSSSSLVCFAILFGFERIEFDFLFDIFHGISVTTKKELGPREKSTHY